MDEEELRAKVEKLRAALKPFVEWIRGVDDYAKTAVVPALIEDSRQVGFRLDAEGAPHPNVGDCRRAAEVYAETTP